MMKRKTMVTVLFMEFSIIFTVCLIASNILETKQMVFGPLHFNKPTMSEEPVWVTAAKNK